MSVRGLELDTFRGLVQMVISSVMQPAESDPGAASLPPHSKYLRGTPLFRLFRVSTMLTVTLTHTGNTNTYWKHTWFSFSNQDA